MFCINCGKKLDEGAKFCAYCGFAVGATMTAETVPESNENAAVSGGDMDYRKFQDKFEALRDNGEKPDEVLKVLEEGLQSWPNDDYLLIWGATFALHSESFDKAIQYATRAINVDSSIGTSYSLRGQAYFRMDDHESAMKDFTRAIDLGYQDFFCYFLRGYIYYFHMEDCEKAIKDLTKAIELDPSFKNCYATRGKAYCYMEDYESAVKDFTKAIEFDSQYPDYYFWRGRVYSFMDNYNPENVIKDLTHAIELGLQEAECYSLRGNAYFDMEDLEKAMKDLTKAINLDGSDPLSYYSRGVIHELFGGFQQAINDYRKALELDPALEGCEEALREAEEKLENE